MSTKLTPEQQQATIDRFGIFDQEKQDIAELRQQLAAEGARE